MFKKKIFSQEECKAALQAINYLGVNEDGVDLLMQNEEPEAYQTLVSIVECYLSQTQPYLDSQLDPDQLETVIKHLNAVEGMLTNQGRVKEAEDYSAIKKKLFDQLDQQKKIFSEE